MGQTLTNNIYLPDEGERNCYAGLAANWRALDAHLGNTDIHVTYADKQAWNEHVADTVKHVTASDKQTWNGKQDALSQTQLDAVNSGIDSSKVQQIATNTSDISSLQSGKANDSDVVHKSGDETIGGDKTFNDLQIIGYGTQYKGARKAYILPEFSAGYSGLCITTLSFAQTLKIGNFVLDANNNPSLDTTKAYIQCATGENNGVNACVLEPRNSTSSSLGTSLNKWIKFNGLEPSSLSLPSDNLNDVIDISSYLTYLDGHANTYIAPANGWISITMSNSSGVQAYISGLWGHQVVRPSAGTIRFLMPILKDKTTNILIFGGAISNARFIPCQGNV